LFCITYNNVLQVTSRIELFKNCRCFGFTHGDSSSVGDRVVPRHSYKFPQEILLQSQAEDHTSIGSSPDFHIGKKTIHDWFLSITFGSLISCEILAKLPKCLSLSYLISNGDDRGAWLAQSVEHVTLDTGVTSLNPTLGVEFPQKNPKKPSGDESTNVAALF